MMPWLRLAIAFVIVIAAVGNSGIAAAQNLRELAREHAREHPGVPLQQTGPPGDYWPKSIRELAKEADLVLHARLSRIQSYLASSEDRILTDYSIESPRLVTGDLPAASTQTPGTRVPLILTVYGGEAVVEGVLIRGTDSSREPINDGGEYLVFLRKSRRPDAGRYEIHYAGIFEIAQDKVRPLLKAGQDVFKGASDARLKDLILEVEAARRTR